MEFDIIQEWNETDHPFPSDRTVHSLFEEQAHKTPDNIALVYENIKLTYKELNERANQLAHYIKNKYQITPDTPVLLYIERNEYMLVSILAVLKAGGAYVPIDTDYPDERIKYIIEDTKAILLITNNLHKERINNITSKASNIVNVEFVDENDDEKPPQSKENPSTNIESKDLAYIIYTSGTTGNPKGVMIEHASVVNTLYSQLEYLGLANCKEYLTFGMLLNYSFDASVSNLFLPLICGHKLCIKADFLSDVTKFIEQYQINIISIPSSMMRLLTTVSKSLKLIFSGGEQANQDVVRKFIDSGVSIFQEYGLTETSIVNTYKKLSFDTKPSIIGHPIFNTKCYILDEGLKLLPIGSVGELYIGGVGLARGYLNNQELTDERFIANPFQNKEEKKAGINGRIYKTGDLVRWLHDGNLEYIGRKDFQVKLRGHRIELGEVENAISNYPEIERKRQLLCTL